MKEEMVYNVFLCQTKYSHCLSSYLHVPYFLHLDCMM